MNNEVLKNLSYGVYVVTSVCGENPTGCVANSLIQVTYNTIAVSIHHDNYTNKCIDESKKFGVSILGVDIDNKVIGTFGYRSARDIDKFKDIPTKTVSGLRIIEDSVGYLICDVVDKMETETHTIFLGKIVDGDMLHNEIPMTYAYYHTERKGLSPKNAPTYIENKPKDKLAYRCTVCNYVYEGDITKEPDTYLCPICKQPKSKFVKIL